MQKKIATNITQNKTVLKSVGALASLKNFASSIASSLIYSLAVL